MHQCGQIHFAHLHIVSKCSDLGGEEFAPTRTSNILHQEACDIFHYQYRWPTFTYVLHRASQGRNLRVNCPPVKQGGRISLVDPLPKPLVAQNTFLRMKPSLQQLHPFPNEQEPICQELIGSGSLNADHKPVCNNAALPVPILSFLATSSLVKPFCFLFCQLLRVCCCGLLRGPDSHLAHRCALNGAHENPRTVRCPGVCGGSHLQPWA